MRSTTPQTNTINVHLGNITNQYEEVSRSERESFN